MVLRKTKRNRRILLWLEIKGLKIHLFDRDVQSGRLSTELVFFLFNSNKGKVTCPLREGDLLGNRRFHTISIRDS